MLRVFANERDWEKFHSPKNLSMALSVEVSELLEHFQWLTEEESGNLSSRARYEIEEEIGDVLIYLVRLADRLGIDPLEAARKKIKKNRDKYPVEKARGNVKIYTEIE